MSAPILNLKKVNLSFGVKPLFTELSLSIYPEDRICIVGKNGEGKSSLLKVLANVYELDSGEKWIMPGVSVGYLPQDITIADNKTVYEFVLNEVAVEQRQYSSYLADIILTPLGLDANTRLNSLSGGLIRKAAFAKTLVLNPNILLLDEPTNHLDIDTIEWMEQYLKNYQGAIVCISHDRAFLKKISNKTFWLDRGDLRINQAGYENFEQWSIEILEQEQRELDKADKKLAEEELWKIQGITARRKRNQRRLSELYILREKNKEDKAARKTLLNKIQLEPMREEAASKLICEFKEVNKNFQNRKILENFSLRINRKERIGIVGANGTGKTTFLKLLIAQEQPDTGYIRIGKNVSYTYYDQRRAQLNPEDTLWKVLCPDGGEYVKLTERYIHVVAYLKNFLFDAKQAQEKVSTLSGGQANRLLLAKALANPGTLLILDEPTNDLDMDTLDMIKDILYDYPGTLLVVSHDRDFLDNITTKILNFSGNGVVEEFVGSYSELRKTAQLIKTPVNHKAKTQLTSPIINKNTLKKLSYSLQRELDLMPQTIKTLEDELAVIEATLSIPNLYNDDQLCFIENSNNLAIKQKKLESLWQRWQELENLDNAISLS